jgi:putative spermidine/putrescine transport system ATP-binding protein
MTRPLQPDACGDESGAALRLIDIAKRFGAAEVVRDLSLTVRAGEFLTLLGPSGSGKTTVLTMIAGFEAPTRGDVIILGRRMNDVPAYRRGVGFVFQSYALFPHLTVFENIAFPLRSRRQAEAAITRRVDTLLALVGLAAYAARLPGVLSGGQQQRVALARALAAEPSLLLLDEPLGALDRVLRDQMMMEFRRIHRVLGTTMIYVTHDQQEALVMSDRIAVMREGRLLCVASPAALYHDPQTAFLAGFLGDANILEGRRTSSVQATMAGGLSVAVPPGAPGSVAVIVVRPERIMLGDAPEVWNRGSGRVIDVQFLGAVSKYRIDYGAPTPLLVQRANDRATALPIEGTKIRFGWHPEDSTVLAAPDTFRGEHADHYAAR